MKVSVKASGTMKRHFSEEAIDDNLADGSTIGGLLENIDFHLKSIFPDSLWNKRTRQFRGPVVILIDQMVISHLKTPLRNG